MLIFFTISNLCLSYYFCTLVLICMRPGVELTRILKYSTSFTCCDLFVTLLPSSAEAQELFLSTFCTIVTTNYYFVVVHSQIVFPILLPTKLGLLSLLYSFGLDSIKLQLIGFESLVWLVGSFGLVDLTW